jgi:hypothetical protein
MNKNTANELKKVLNEDLNWDYIMKRAIKEDISSLVYWNLRRIEEGKKLPETVMAQLKKKYLETVGQNMLYSYELGRILKTFKDAGIATICLKGAFLAESIYQNIGLRSLSDIDLLIRDTDLQMTKTVLPQLRYQPVDVYPTEWHEQWWTLLCKNQQIVYVNMKKKVFLEINWHIQSLSSPFEINIDTFWKNAQPVTIADVEALAFAPEDLLQHLCVHLYKHGIQGATRLKWYCDIAEVIEFYGEKISWKYLLESTRNYRTEEPMYSGLYSVKAFLGASVPSHILNKLNPDIYITFENMFGKKFKSLKKKKSLRKTNYLFTLKEVDGIWKKIYLLLKDIFPSKKFMIRHYSIKKKSLVYVYYFLRLGAAFKWGIFLLQQTFSYLQNCFQKLY